MKLSMGLFRYYFQRMIKGGRAREICSAIIRKFLPRHGIKFSESEEATLALIRQRGFYSLPAFINQGDIQSILDGLKDSKVYDRYDKGRKLFNPLAPPEYARTGAYLNKDIIESPEIIKLANHPELIRLVSGYLGCKPTLSNITMWHSYASNTGDAKNSENYHRDVDDFKFIKVFFYLSNVGYDDGPHVYIDGSHHGTEFLDIRRFDDQEIENFYSENSIRYITGKAGDGFIESTYGIHKGLVPQKSGRIVLQFEYSLLPIGAYTYLDKYPTKVANGLDIYTNRLFL